MNPTKLFLVSAIAIGLPIVILASCGQKTKTTDELAQQHQANEIPKAKLAELRNTLELANEMDQRYRHQLTSAVSKYGHDSAEVAAISAKCKDADAANLRIVSGILNEYGWLSVEQVGQMANRTLFLVTQHADAVPGTQEKYLPMIRKAVTANKASAAHLAMLEDRIAIGKGEPQIYGSQMTRIAGTETYQVAPIRDPNSVDERRAKVGLASMNEYVKLWNLDWHIELQRLLIADSNEGKESIENR